MRYRAQKNRIDVERAILHCAIESGRLQLLWGLDKPTHLCPCQLGVRHVFGRMNSLATKTRNLPPQVEISVCEGTLGILVGVISIAHRITQDFDAHPRQLSTVTRQLALLTKP